MASVADREADDNAKLQKEMMEQLNANPVMKRKFMHTSSTSNAVQVIWSHPDELKGVDKKALTYQLQYGVGGKLNKQE